MGNSRCTAHSVYVSGQKIQLSENSVWVKLPDGEITRVEHWSSLSPTMSACLVLPLDAPTPQAQDFFGTPAEGFLGVSSSISARGRGGRNAGKNPDIRRPAVSGAQVHTALFNQSQVARSVLPTDPTEFREALSERQSYLLQRPTVPIEHFQAPRPTHTTFSRVPLELVASLGSGDSWEKNLNLNSPEILRAAETLLEPDPQGPEKVFHLQSDPFERIRVTAYEGPMGPIYTGSEGSYRTAGAMVAGLDSVYADVQRISYPSIVNKSRAEILPLLRAGLVRGGFERDAAGNEVFRATNAIVPWIFSEPEAIAEVGAAYLRAYPDGFESLPIPPEVLSDASAFKEFLKDHEDAPPYSLQEFIDKPGPSSPLKDGESRDAGGIKHAAVSLQAKVGSDAYLAPAAAGPLRKRNQALGKGYLLSFEDSSKGGTSLIRDTYGNIGAESTMIPSGWKAIWILDPSINRPYGSDYRVVVYNPAEYAVDETGTLAGTTVESFSGTRLVKK